MQKRLMQAKFSKPLNRQANNNCSDFSPLSWHGYFEEEFDLEIDHDSFHVYCAGKGGPVCMLLHGGGFSGLSWALFSNHLRSMVEVRVVAMDMRGHGKTHTNDDQQLSCDVLAEDVARVARHLYNDDWPAIVLVGHSMGGAIAVRVAHQELLPTLAGLVVIDVVEGTAMEALSSMKSFLSNRPSSFPSLPAAIQYCRKSGQIKNLESARVSVIGQLKPLPHHPTTNHASPSTYVMPTSFNDVIKEEGDDDDAVVDGNCEEQPTSTSPYTWRLDLSSTEPFWKGWFEGLSSRFLSCKPPKLLMLAGVDRLDKDLTIGQMQGKFQMELLPQSGHVVHEDCPAKVAEKLAAFLSRFKLAQVPSL